MGEDDRKLSKNSLAISPVTWGWYESYFVVFFSCLWDFFSRRILLVSKRKCRIFLISQLSNFHTYKTLRSPFANRPVYCFDTVQREEGRQEGREGVSVREMLISSLLVLTSVSEKAIAACLADCYQGSNAQLIQTYNLIGGGRGCGKDSKTETRLFLTVSW